MKSFIPKDIWFFTSIPGMYNFLYPCDNCVQAQNDIIAEELPWHQQRGLTSFKTVLGVIWCDKKSIKNDKSV